MVILICRYFRYVILDVKEFLLESGGVCFGLDNLVGSSFTIG